MNLVGKIMIVLILIMSMVFMSFAVAVYATHKNWKETVLGPQGLKVQIAEAKDSNDKLQAKLTLLQEELARELNAKVQAVAKLEEARLAWNTQVTQLQADIAKLEETNKTQLATLETTHRSLETITNEVNGLRDEIRMAQDERDQNFKKVIALTDAVQQTQGELKRLDERRVQLVSQVAQMKVLNAYNLTEYTPVDKRPPPLHGKVVAVNQNDMVELSLGSDDGIRADHELDIYRATNYLGRVQVLSTSTDRAVGKILASYKKGIIQKGDDVATRFKSN